MKLYNTLTKTKEEFVPRIPGRFVCIPADRRFNYFHIGNARPFIIFDVFADIWSTRDTR